MRVSKKVLTATKRAEIRARKHEIDLQEKQAKNKLKRMDDHDEKLRAVVSMPAVPSKHSAAAGVGGDGAVGGSHPKKDRKRGRSLSEAGKGGGEDGGSRERERDPLTAWVYDCYHNDGYAGHVSDLRQFLKGIEFRHVSGWWRTVAYTIYLFGWAILYPGSDQRFVDWSSFPSNPLGHWESVIRLSRSPLVRSSVVAYLKFLSNYL